MKLLGTIGLFFLASCQSFSVGDPVASYWEAHRSDLAEDSDDELKAEHGGRVGLLFGPDTEEEDAGPGKRGLLGDLSLGHGRWSDRVGSAEVETARTDIAMGLRYVFDTNTFVEPFLGGGVTFQYMDAETTSTGFGSVSDDSTAIGGYAMAGVDFRVSNAASIGLGLRVTEGLDFKGEDDIEVDLDQRGFFISYVYSPK